MKAPPFQMEMSVRDYECDMQGIVNNAVYQNYLEHARHEYLKSIGIDFADYTRRGINLVVVRIEMDFRSSLTSGDRFAVDVRMERESRVRLAFHQNIRRLMDAKPVIQGRVIATSLNARGRPEIPAEFETLFATMEM